MSLSSLRKSVMMLCATRQISEDAKDALLGQVDELIGPEMKDEPPHRSFVQMIADQRDAKRAP